MPSCNCFIIPPTILKHISTSQHVEEETRQIFAHSFNLTQELRGHRVELTQATQAGAAGAASHAHGIIPPRLQSAAAQHTESSRGSLLQDELIRAARKEGAQAQAKKPAKPTLTDHNLNRIIYTAKNLQKLPGDLVRSEGQPAVTSDQTHDADEAYDNYKATYDFYFQHMKRDSVDGKGMPIKATVHYGKKYQNAFWNGTQMVFGDGDGVIFNDFTDQIDVVGHELTHGVTEKTANLDYQDQSGALNESVSDCFGSMIKQFTLNQKAADADWLIGEGIFTKAIKGVALRSMKAPGTAYNDPKIGKDDQPDHMKNYVNTTEDQGGVHTNSGIPNKAFYNASIALGGYSWEKAGQIWYATLTGGVLSSSADFQEFADLTVKNAKKLFDDDAATKVTQAWADVGITAKA